MESRSFIIFPTQHLVKQYTDYCLAQSASGIVSANAMSFDGLVTKCLANSQNKTYISDMQKKALIDAIMRKSDLKYFKQILPGYVWAVAEDISELKMACIGPNDFKNLWLSNDIPAWASDMYEIFAAYEEALSINSLCDKEGRYAAAADELSKALPLTLRDAYIVKFMYFFDITPLQQRIIDAIKSRKRCELIDGLADDGFISAPDVAFISASDRRTECLWVADKIKELLQNGLKCSDICIIARDIAPYASMLNWAYKQKKLNFGNNNVLLIDNPMIAAILLFLDSLCSAPPDAEKIADNPYLEALGVQGAVFGQSASPADYAGQLWTLMENSVLKSYISDEGQKGHLNQMISDIKAYEQFRSVLDAIMSAQEWGNSAANISLSDFCAMLHRMCAEEVYNKAVSYNEGPLLLTPSAARGLERPAVFMVGMVEGEFPRAIRPDWLIRDSARPDDSGMLTSRALLARERMFFNVAVRTAKHALFMSCPRVDSDGNPMLISSFVEDVMELLPDMPVCEISQEDVLDTTGNVQTAEKAGYEASGAVIPYINNKFIKSPLSATFFNEYGICSYKFYMARLIGLSAAEEEEGPSALDIGTAYHEILKRFMQPYIKEGLNAAEREKYANELTDIADDVLDGSPIRERYASAALYAMEKQRMITLLSGWLDAELKLSKSHGGMYKPFCLEQPFGMGGWPPLTLKNNNIEIMLTGRIDRIDVSDDGRFMIYDYKKGKTSYTIDDIRDGIDFQLPIYVWAAERFMANSGYRPAGVAYYSIEGAGLKGKILKNDSGIKVRGSNSSVLDQDKWDELMAQSQGMIFKYFGDIISGRYPKEPKKCPLLDEYNGGFCDFTDICNA